MNAFTVDAVPLKFRYAPTPSGFLHEGNICNFLLVWVLARASGGKILLRIDDLDRERFRKPYLEDIFRKLDSLGLDYDEGPAGPDDFEKNWSQVLRIDQYQRWLNLLISSENIFACKCSRKETEEGKICNCNLQKHTDDQVAWKYRTNGAGFQEWQDQITGFTSISIHDTTPFFTVRKNNGFPGYQITSLADDLHFGITDIVRGQDLIASTAIQQLLSKELKAQKFLQTRFYHHPLLSHASGEKLSKSAGDHLLTDMATGSMSDKLQTMVQQVAKWLLISEPVNTKEELLSAFLERT